MGKRGLSLCLTMALFFTPELGRAQPPPSGHSAATGTVVIEVKDGAVFRGQIVEKIPGQYVTVQLATGEIRKIRWDAIARETAEAPVVPGPAATESAAASDVRVTFRPTSDEAVLERLSLNDSWITVCDGPCTTRVDSKRPYRVAGRGIVRSRPFRLPSDKERVVIDSDEGTTGTTVIGVVMMGLGGGAVLFVGLPLLLVGALGESVDDATDDETDFEGATTAGALVTLGGAAVGIGGLIMVINNRTNVQVSRGAVQAPRLALPGGLQLTPSGIVF